MDGWLKGLVAAACIVVIAFGLHAAWRSYTGYQLNQQNEIAKVRLFNLAGVQQGDESGMRLACARWSQSETLKANPLADEVLQNCRFLRYL